MEFASVRVEEPSEEQSFVPLPLTSIWLEDEGGVREWSSVALRALGSIAVDQILLKDALLRLEANLRILQSDLSLDVRQFLTGSQQPDAVVHCMVAKKIEMQDELLRTQDDVARLQRELDDERRVCDEMSGSLSKELDKIRRDAKLVSERVKRTKARLKTRGEQLRLARMRVATTGKVDVEMLKTIRDAARKELYDLVPFHGLIGGLMEGGIKGLGIGAARAGAKVAPKLAGPAALTAEVIQAGYAILRAPFMHEEVESAERMCKLKADSVGQTLKNIDDANKRLNDDAAKAEYDLDALRAKEAEIEQRIADYALRKQAGARTTNEKISQLHEQAAALAKAIEELQAG